jgi:hypothetical protein
MTLIVYVETEECELESFDDDDEDDETADDDEDDCYDYDRANKSIHSNPETDNLTASSLNKQSKTDLSSSAVASDDEHTIISSNGSKDVDDDWHQIASTVVKKEFSCVKGLSNLLFKFFFIC